MTIGALKPVEGKEAVDALKKELADLPIPDMSPLFEERNESMLPTILSIVGLILQFVTLVGIAFVFFNLK